jgi:hypothetical protein
MPRRNGLTTAVLALLALASPARPGTALRITCSDGGGDLFEGHGRSVLSSGFCDTDHTCDGNCTFAFNPECAVCLGRFSGRLTCSPDGHEEVCPLLPPPPCPSGLPHVVLSLGNKGHAHKRMRFRVGRRSFTLILRCDYGHACGAQPQPPPPGIPNVDGDWDLQETTADTDCAPSVATYLRPPGSVRLAQDGFGLTACFDPEDDASSRMSPVGQGTVSNSTLDISASVVDFDGSHSYALNVVGPLPGDATSTTVSEQWSILQGDPPKTVLCSRTATATMSRRPTPPCTGDAECIAIDPCMRCDRSVLRCALNPLCQ